MDRIQINSLRLNNFRNYESLQCSFNEHINVITGLNGAGKTSVLDAVYYLSNGKSYFSHLDAYIYRKSQDYFNLNSSYQIGEDLYNIVLKSSVKGGKQIILDDKPVKSITEYIGKFPAFMIAPKDILILIESSAERRKLIDRTISQVDKVYFKALLNYNKILKQRNAALKTFQKSGKIDYLMLDAFDENMLEPALYIYEKRKSYIDEISPLLNKYYSRISSDSETLKIEYKSKLHSKSLEELLKDSRQRDVIMAKTYEGIHRDDLSLFLDGLDIRKIGSQGQLKSAIISIKISQLEWVKLSNGKAAIILLDDIFDKLDSQRVENLIDICANELEAQIFITDTNESRVSDSLNTLKLKYKHIKIENAKLLDE